MTGIAIPITIGRALAVNKWMIENNITLRLIVGSAWVAMGLACLIIYFDLNKKLIWKKFSSRKTTKVRKRRTSLYSQDLWLLFGGLFSVICGLIALFYGFKGFKHL